MSRLVKAGVLLGTGAAAALYCAYKVKQYSVAREAKKRERDAKVHGFVMGVQAMAGGALFAAGVYGFYSLRNKIVR